MSTMGRRLVLAAREATVRPAGPLPMIATPVLILTLGSGHGARQNRLPAGLIKGTRLWSPDRATSA